MRRALIAGSVTLAAFVSAVALACSSFSADDSGAASDGGTGAMDASAFSCATVDAQFCWSFDEGSQPLVGPLLVATQPSPALTSEAKSPPSAMQAVLSGVGTTALELDVTATVRKLRCELDLELVALSTPGPVAVLGFDYDWSFGYYPMLQVTKANETTARMDLSFLGQPDTDLGNVPIGQWVHVYLEAEASGAGNYRATGGVAGNADGTRAIALDGGTDTLPHFRQVRFGLSTIYSTAWTVRYDDLVCRWQ